MPQHNNNWLIEFGCRASAFLCLFVFVAIVAFNFPHGYGFSLWEKVLGWAVILVLSCLCALAWGRWKGYMRAKRTKQLSLLLSRLARLMLIHANEHDLYPDEERHPLLHEGSGAVFFAYAVMRATMHKLNIFRSSYSGDWFSLRAYVVGALIEHDPDSLLLGMLERHGDDEKPDADKWQEAGHDALKPYDEVVEQANGVALRLHMPLFRLISPYFGGEGADATLTKRFKGVAMEAEDIAEQELRKIYKKLSAGRVG